MSCKIESNKVYVDDIPADYTGNFTLKVQNVPNIVEVGTCDTIIFKIYDGINYKITEKSYWNLDPSNFEYVVPGPLITVNNN